MYCVRILYNDGRDLFSDINISEARQMSINWQEILFTFLGGLGIFLFSIKYMGDGLQQAAGDKLRYYIDKYTSNPFYGVLVGIAITALIQSSSGVTAIAIGLVSAGLLSLRQAIGIIMGANIGTTVTSFLIGFKLGDYGLPILFLGALLLVFVQNQKLNNLGRILFGLGGLFFALELMGAAMEPLKDVEAIHTYMATLGNKPIQGVLLGTVFTVLIQSSSATIGILQGMYASGLLDLQGSLPIMLGSNIGTTITAVLAALGGNIVAKRVAGAHTLFNLVGAVIFLFMLTPLTAFIGWLGMQMNLTAEMEIAVSHGIFNIVSTVILFPFIGTLAYIVTKLIPGEDEQEKYEPHYLDRILLAQSPSLALGNAKKELIHLGAYATQSFEAAFRFIETNDPIYAKKVQRYEDAVNNIDEQLTHYLIDLSKANLAESESEVLAGILDASRDLERISDHAVNLVHLTEYNISKDISFSGTAQKELEEIYTKTHSILLDAIKVVADSDLVLVGEIKANHKYLEDLERRIRRSHIKRMNEGVCTPLAGINFIDLITPSTRISDHALNLAEKVEMNQL